MINNAFHHNLPCSAGPDPDNMLMVKNEQPIGGFVGARKT